MGLVAFFRSVTTMEHTAAVQNGTVLADGVQPHLTLAQMNVGDIAQVRSC